MKTTANTLIRILYGIHICLGLITLVAFMISMQYLGKSIVLLIVFLILNCITTYIIIQSIDLIYEFVPNKKNEVILNETKHNRRN